MLLGGTQKEVEDEEDDTHLCLRCNAKIIGLENYVEHRKSFCSTTKLINKTTTSSRITSGGGGGARQSAETAQNEGTALAVVVEIEEEQQQAILETLEQDEDDDDEGAPSASPMVAMSMRPVEPSPGTAINNQAPLKFKAPPFTGPGSDYGKSPERRGRGGAAGDGFPNFTVTVAAAAEDEHHHQSNYSKTVLDKSLEFNLDYDNEFEVVGHHPSSSASSVVGAAASTAELRADGHEYENLFFSSLQLQSSAKTPKRPLDDTIHHHQEGGGGKLDRRGDAEDISRSRTNCLYELDVGSSEEEEDEDEDETEEELYLQELEYESEMDDEFEENFRGPPRSHTGGKWKPDDRPSATIRSSATTTAVAPSSTAPTGGDVVNENFLWSEVKASASSSAEDVIVIMDEAEDEFPPQDYTRGKWVPGGGGGAERGGTSISRRFSESPIKEQISTADYRSMATGEDTGTKSFWCSVCNRTLASEPIFQRHLTSNFHKERAQMEAELEQGRTFFGGGSGDSLSSARRGSVIPGGRSINKTQSYARGVAINADWAGSEEESASGKRKSNLADNRPSSSPPGSASSIAKRVKRVTKVGGRKRSQSAILTSSAPSSTVAAVADKQSKSKKRKRNRPCIYTDCGACKVRLPIALMGRHLLSHMHYRRMRLWRAQDQSLVLNYLDQIVRLSPFQCQVCRFSATTQELFMRHWHSQEHKAQVQEAQVQRMWCSFCKYAGPVSGMTRHLQSPAHQEVIDALNRTCPIVIRQKTDLGCVTCGKAFPTNLQIRKHKCAGGTRGGGGRKKGFADTASDEYQSIFKCENCDQVFRKLHKLKRHNAEQHSQGKTYQCFKCALVFLTEKEALKHRGSLEHKVMVAKLSGRRFAKRPCRQCPLEFEDPLQLRDHVQESHAGNRFSCLLCGATFKVSQSLSHHMKRKLCLKPSPEEDQAEKETCGQLKSCSRLLCSYQSSSESEMLLHNALLHDHPELAFDTLAKVPCPLCPKSFKRASLIGHLRKHTNERPFACPDCPSSYTRKANLVEHMAKCKGEDTVTRTPLEKPKQGTFGQYACPETGCNYRTTKQQNLRKHAVVHKDKSFACDKCDYKASEARFMKQHSLVHTQEQPYTCSECQKGFSCISNLRKHFMSAHDSLQNALYKCGECRFTCKYQSELKVHNCLRYK